MDYFAVIDTETNWNNEVMSIGVVIAEKDTFKKVDDLYFIFDPEYKIGGMFSMVLPVKGRAPKDLLFTRKIAMEKFKEAFEKYGVKDLFAYNGTFDKTIKVDTRGNYVFAVRNNSSQSISVSGYVKY